MPDDGSKKNLYGELLTEAMKKRGVTLIPIPYSHLFSLQVLDSRPDVIHFEFISPFILPYEWRFGSLIAIIKGLLFICQVIFLRIMGIRLIWTIHGLVNHEKRHPHVEWFFNLLFTRLAQGFIIHGKFPTNEAIKRYYLHNMTDKICSLPYPNYIRAYPNDIDRSDARKQLGIEQNVPVLLCFGQVRPYKNIPQVIESFKKLLPKSPSSQLWIVGEAIDLSLASEISKLASDCGNIKIISEHVPDDKLQIYVNACDFMVFNYSMLTSGAAVLAMSFARGVIAPRLGGMLEVLDDQGAILYNPEDEKGLDEALNKVLTGKVEAENLGNYNYKRALKWDWDKSAKQILTCYKGDDSTSIKK